jgi:hypothetical protein
MSWQRRLLELVSAGGALSAAGCQLGGGGGGCGNGLPDPCIWPRNRDIAVASGDRPTRKVA